MPKATRCWCLIDIDTKVLDIDTKVDAKASMYRCVDIVRIFITTAKSNLAVGLFFLIVPFLVGLGRVYAFGF